MVPRASKDIALSKKVGHAKNQSFNIGDWVSAKIYSDSKNGCRCGCRTWIRKPVDGLADYDQPMCEKCNSRPELYVIVALIEDEDGREERIKVRHTPDGDRLKDIHDVVYTLKNVNREIAGNTFDYGKYLSRESRESYIFDKIVAMYLHHHEKRLLRGELSPAGMKDKKTLIKNHLMPVFKGLDIGTISGKRIRAFYNSYTDSLRMRDKATGELKTIMNFAASDDCKKLHNVPEFPEIKASNMVEDDVLITLQQQDSVIDKIENPVYRLAIRTLAIYGIRPCEVRTLKWEDVNKEKEVVFIRSHISLNQEISGRKSQAGKVHALPVVPEFEEVLEEIKKILPRVINAKDYIFKGAHGGPIGQNVLTRAWNDACKLARIRGVTLYQGTKHSTLSDLGENHSDSKLIKLSGHTNTKTIRRYNQSNLKQVREMLIARRG